MLHLLSVLLLVTLLTHLLLAILPGDPADALLGEAATPEAAEVLRLQLALDKPVYIRYVKWLGAAISGDFGVSYHSGESVFASIVARLPVSVELMLLASLLALLIAVPLGVFTSHKAGSLFDKTTTVTAFCLISLPNYVLGIVLILVFSIASEFLPATGYVPFTEDPVGNLRSLVLPSLTLGLAEAAVYLRVLRSNMLSTLREPYILAARAKGVPDGRLLFVHALRPSLLTMITIVGVNIGNLIGGALIVETIFALPGVGRLLVNAIYARDIILIQGVVVFIAIAYVLVNFLVDVIHGILDPRVRYGHSI